MSFDDEPDEETGRKVEGADGAWGDVDLKKCAGFYLQGDHPAARFEGNNRAGENVAGAEEVRRLGGNENVTGANGDANFAAGFGFAERDFDFAGGMIERDAHDAVGGTVFDND